ncbi:phospholipid methyltransferase [Acrasis kona]|uniref:Phospholipid methyltransferase n=1 Tax=Acrasis kona TaxID=1008807 RepID=A0AAW2YN24_9EUKA
MIAESVVAIVVCLLTLWLYSVFVKDVSIIDSFWGTCFVITCWIGVFCGEGSLERRIFITTLVTIWGLRLSIHLLVRNHGQEEDYRYQSMRQRIPYFRFTSLFVVFGLQGFLAIIISAPLYNQLSSKTSVPTSTDVIGLMVWIFGFVFEAIGDYQLTAFKSDKKNKGKLLTTGVWKYTRHPNYFGDAMQWWAYYITSLPGGWWTIFSPALMTFLLLKISGVSLLEQKMSKSKPGYEQYQKNTGAFLPSLTAIGKDLTSILNK